MARRRAKVRSTRREGTPGVTAIGQARAPFEDLYHVVLVQPWWQYFLVVMSAWFALVLAFATAYWLAGDAITNTKGFEDCFYFSVQTLSTIGYGVMAPATRTGHMLVTFEALVGTLLLALLTGATFAKFARPTAKVLFSDRAVIVPRNARFADVVDLDRGRRIVDYSRFHDIVPLERGEGR